MSNQKKPIVFCWSGGKDSSYALHKLQESGQYDIRYLLSTFNGNLHRLSMHGIREELIEKQAEMIGIPLLKVYVYESNNDEYEQQMNATLTRLKAEGIDTAAYGDIFLEDLRIYREEKMQSIGMHCLFPLWKIDTTEMVRDFIAKGFKTYTCCVNDGYLDKSFCGRLIDASFLKHLPANVDPCGENGEFHSFCTDGPIFKKPIDIQLGDFVYRELSLKITDNHPGVVDVGTKGFWYREIQLAN